MGVVSILLVVPAGDHCILAQGNSGLSLALSLIWYSSMNCSIYLVLHSLSDVHMNVNVIKYIKEEGDVSSLGVYHISFAVWVDEGDPKSYVHIGGLGKSSTYGTSHALFLYHSLVY